MLSVLLKLNAKLLPMHRGMIFEDPIDDILKKNNIGEVTGGGTLTDKNGEVLECDIEFSISEDRIDDFVDFLDNIDIIPKGSSLVADGKEFAIGKAEGLALYLDGTTLPAKVYESYDINELIDLIDTSLVDIGERLSHWEGNTHTALYYYGRSFEEMKRMILQITERYPLCENCMIVQIA
ncbi:MAG: hypothetical protein E7218_02640 [Anaerofustis stercorihominis]|nr:hypothetical protein [Anaerofustis stercorihominis]